MTAIAYLIAIVSGIAATSQVSFNNGIRRSLRSPFTTAAVNFVTAFGIMLAARLITEGSLALPLSEITKYPPWIWTGGMCGVVIVMAGIYCLPVLGSANSMMLMCFGQIMTGLVIDHFGLFSAPVSKMTPVRFIGALLEIAGVVLISMGKGGPAASKKGGRVLPYVILDVLAGAAGAMQVAINGTMTVAAGSALRSTFVSMTGALITTTVIISLIRAVKGRAALYDDETPPEGHVKFRLFFLTGGLAALTVVGGNAFTGPVLGTGAVTIMNLFGMMASGLVIDAVGFMGIEKKPVTAAKIAGMALMLAGTAMISL